MRPVQLWTTGCPRVVGSDGTVSIVEIVLFSPRVENLKGNKSFVPELPRVVSVSSVFRIPMHMNVLQIRKFHISVYFTHPYICIFCITMHMGMLQWDPKFKMF